MVWKLERLNLFRKRYAFIHDSSNTELTLFALQERTDLRWWSLIPQFTLWAAANTNILSFSAGVLGPNLFGLDFKSSVWVIIVFNVLSAIPVAYFATFGPLLGMRQMVQTRYSFGYVRCDCYCSVK